MYKYFGHSSQTLSDEDHLENIPDDDSELRVYAGALKGAQ
jgi:hypothetical protein